MERAAGAGPAWDSFTQVTAQDLDPGALEGLLRDRQGRVDMAAQATGRSRIDGQTYLDLDG